MSLYRFHQAQDLPLGKISQLFPNFEMAFTVCEFHITCHLLCWDSGGGATNSPSHVLYMGVLYSCSWDDKLYPISGFLGQRHITVYWS